MRFAMDASKFFSASEALPLAAVTISKLYVTETSDPDVPPNDPSPLLAHAPLVGDTVGNVVGDTVGDAVGDTVGDEVGNRIGDTEGDAVGESCDGGTGTNAPASFVFLSGDTFECELGNFLAEELLVTTKAELACWADRLIIAAIRALDIRRE